MEDQANKEVAPDKMMVEFLIEAYSNKTISFLKLDLATDVPNISTDISFEWSITVNLILLCHKDINGEWLKL